jgi:hypothetical protein
MKGKSLLNHILKLNCTALAFGLVSLIVSCQADHRYLNIGNDYRWVSVLPWYADPPQGPLSVMTISQVHTRYSEESNHADWLTKVELDFGEGLGWQDITQQFRASPYFRVRDPQLSLTHTYAQAGTYTIRIRATYWDGEVVTTSEMHSSAAITVTVPHT